MLLKVRVKDRGESECQSVMGWIGVAPQGNITPGESGQTSTWCFLTQQRDEPLKKGKQMTTLRR
jgi:hypothetical protein